MLIFNSRNMCKQAGNMTPDSISYTLEYNVWEKGKKHFNFSQPPLSCNLKCYNTVIIIKCVFKIVQNVIHRFKKWCKV